MGNKDSRSKFEQGYIYVEMGPEQVVGEYVGGCVHLNLLSKFPGGRVDLFVKGTAKTKRFVKKKGEVERRPNKHVFLSKKVVLHEFPGDCIERGQYSFPFSTAFPDWLPPSCMFRGKATKYSISYKVKGVVKDPSNQTRPLTYSKKVILLTPDPLLDFNKSLPPIVKPLSSYCLLRNKATINLTFNKEAYLNSETL